MVVVVLLQAAAEATAQSYILLPFLLPGTKGRKATLVSRHLMRAATAT